MRTTAWDAGATTWDSDRTKFDAEALGSKRVVKPNAPTAQYRAVKEALTTWDAGTTTWDNQSTRWDVTVTGQEPADAFTANLEKQRTYGLSFAMLASWKQARWNACARARGMSGRALYLQCSNEQRTPEDKEPISPCARRVLDPNASPFDFTP
jgi:hypothetical protein